MINFYDYLKFCDYQYKGGDIPSGNAVVYCSTPKIKEFFARCEKTNNRFVVVSAGNDFGCFLQQTNPPANDIIKWLLMHDLLDYGYQTLHLEPRCDIKQCCETDKYIIKCYAFSSHSFNNIPDNIVRWYLTHAGLQHDKITPLPLGVNLDAKESIKKHQNIPKTKWLYINHQNYTYERMLSKGYFAAKDYDWVTLREEPNIPFNDYLKEMAEHRFILCLPGNGICCFKIWEALYLGCIPIVINSPHFEGLKELPIVRIADYEQITLEMLKWAYKNTIRGNLKKSILAYWGKEINESRKQL